MIYIDDNDPEGELESSFPSRDVKINWNVDAKGIFDIIDEIGRGKFGTVFRCQEKETGLKLAAKFVPIPKREDRRNADREVEIMNSLQHHLVIQLYAAYEYQKVVCVVQELVEGGELFDRVIDDDFILTERVCTVFMRQLCEAMQFIHRHNILHLDLKPENILCLTKEGNRIKIIDFGLARKYDPNKKLQILFGTPEFVAPEVVNFDCISYGTDMWSVGVICYVLLSGLSPFMGETDIATMANVTIARYDFDDEAFNNVSADAMDFITKLLLKDCSLRMTATECLNHKWLKRKPKPPSKPPPPVISPKPVSIPPPKYKMTPLSPPPLPQLSVSLEQNEDAIEPKELEQTKDNLKSFIERWEEHPNSPYVFDTESNLIAPLRDTNGDSIVSSRACSPSPCESIGSVPEDPESTKESLTTTTSSISLTEDLEKQDHHYHHHHHNNDKHNSNDEEQKHLGFIVEQQQQSKDFNGNEKLHNDIDVNDDDDDSEYNKNFKDYLQSFDRRNSDTNYLLGRRSSGERINLAEEIRKLSDHLLMLAEINTKLCKDDNLQQTNNPNNNNVDSNSNKATIPTTTTTTKKKDLSIALKIPNSIVENDESNFTQLNNNLSDQNNNNIKINNNRNKLSTTLDNISDVCKMLEETKQTINKQTNKLITPVESKLNGDDVDSNKKTTTTNRKSSFMKSSSVIKDSSTTTTTKTPQIPTLSNTNNNNKNTSAITTTIDRHQQNNTSTTESKSDIAQSNDNTTNTIKRNRFIKASSFENNTIKSSLNPPPPSVMSFLSKNTIDSTRVRKLSKRLQNSIENIVNGEKSNNETTNENRLNGNSENIDEIGNGINVIMNDVGGANTKTTTISKSINTKTTTRTFNGFTNQSIVGDENISLITRQIGKNHSKIPHGNMENGHTNHINSDEKHQQLKSSGFKSFLESINSVAAATNNTTNSNNSNDNDIQLTVPWRMTNKRTKFRISQTSRDVPLDSPNTHQAYNLEEAATTTKDCLLHLLEKYNDKKLVRNSHTGRHLSISVDWNSTDNLEHRSMNSINTFFQRHAMNGQKVKQLQAQLKGKSN